jgi:hypothetical protein
MSVAWSADGKVLATACTDNLIRLFDMSDPSSKDPKFRRIQTNGPAVGVGFGDTPEQMVAVLRGELPAGRPGCGPGARGTTGTSP